jgi:hypothetical protein
MDTKKQIEGLKAKIAKLEKLEKQKEKLESLNKKSSLESNKDYQKLKELADEINVNSIEIEPFEVTFKISPKIDKFATNKKGDDFIIVSSNIDVEIVNKEKLPSKLAKSISSLFADYFSEWSYGNNELENHLDDIQEIGEIGAKKELFYKMVKKLAKELKMDEDEIYEHLEVDCRF